MHRSRTTISCRLVAPTVAAALLAATGAVAPEPDPPRPFQSFPTLIAWTTELPAAPIAAPIITSQHVVVPLSSGELVARRLTDGKPGWTQKLLAVAPIVVAEDVVVVPEARAVHGLDAATGERIWTVAVPDVSAPPIARGGWVILASSEGLRAVRAADGVELEYGPVAGAVLHGVRPPKLPPLREWRKAGVP